MISLNLRRKMIFSMILLILVMSLTFGVTYAYFETNKEHGIVIETGEFHVEIFIYFGDLLLDSESPYYDAEKQIVIVNAFDPLADNYIEDLQIYLVITPVVASRLRLKFQDQWEMRRVYIDQPIEDPIPDIVENLYHPKKDSTYYPFSLLKMHPEFTYIYGGDKYLYFDQVIRKDTSTTLHIIDSGDPYPVKSNEVFNETVYVYIDLSIELVQANRFSQVWGIPQDFYINP